VEGLTRTAEVVVVAFKGLRPGEALAEVRKLGEELNEGNPWVSDTRPFSALRVGVLKSDRGRQLSVELARVRFSHALHYPAEPCFSEPLRTRRCYEEFQTI